MDKQQQEQPIDLSKTVPISPQEEAKLADFLKRMQAGIEGDSELEAMLGGAIGKWSSELAAKGEGEAK